jgi:cardiolipin synthase
MKKFFKLIFGRILWIFLIILIEVAAIVLLFLFLEGIIGTIFPIISWILILILELAVMIVIVNSPSNDSYKIAWLVVLIVLPILGAFFYILFANKKFTKRQKRKIKPISDALKKSSTSPEVLNEVQKLNMDAYRMSNYITSASGSALYNKTSSQFFPVGDDAFPVMLSELKKAKHYIFLEYFIIENKGIMWPSILDILSQKVKEGVDVRVMYDDVGSISTVPFNYPSQLKKMGIKVVCFNRFKPVVNVKMNNRDHRKILVIDGFVGFTGGINLADEYINKKVRFGHWKDNAIMLKGEGVYGLTMLFLSNWCASTETIEKDFDYFKPERYGKEVMDHIVSDGYVQPYGDIPFNYEAVGEQVYMNLLEKAEKYVYITTPYLIIDAQMEDALTNAARQGIKVIMLVPHIPDKKTVFNVTRSYYLKLLKSGVKIYEYTPGFVHSKMFIVDDCFGTVGTINLDYRSLYLHLECGTFLFNTSCIKDMKNDFLMSLSVSHEMTVEEVTAISKFKRIWWAILRMFAPLM